MGDTQFEGNLVDELDSHRVQGVDLGCTRVEQPSGSDRVSRDGLDHGIDRSHGERRITTIRSPR
jgi:hypothetical protein